MATAGGTWAYRDRFGDDFGRTYFRRFGPGVVSSVGIGTYLGDPTDAVDDGYREAIVAGLNAGVNLVDTAVNYRCQRSERVVGEALSRADPDREAIVVATKGGFLPFDRTRPEDPGRYVRERFVEPGLVDADDLVAGSHCLAPDYLGWSLERSLSNLGLDAVDCFYVHNPETQLGAVDRGTVYDRLEAAFVELERRVAAGTVGRYGVATWDAFRVPPDDDRHLDLAAVLARARAAADAVGADEHSLAALQLPFNVHMADAFVVDAHRPPEQVADGENRDTHSAGDDRDTHSAGDDRDTHSAGDDRGDDDRVARGERVSALEFAQRAGLSVFTSASIAQGDLVGGVPEAVAARLAGDTPPQRAINFARSAPGVTAALVGTGSVDHLAENAAAGTFDPLGAGAFDAVFE